MPTSLSRETQHIPYPVPQEHPLDITVHERASDGSTIITQGPNVISLHGEQLRLLANTLTRRHLEAMEQ